MGIEFSHVSLGRVGVVSAAATALVFATASAGVAHAYKDVTVSADGATRHVRTFESTPAAVLDAAGVRVGQHDAVHSTSGNRVADGATVTVTSAERVILPTSSGIAQRWVATASTLAAARSLGATKTLPLSHFSHLTSQQLGRSGALTLVHDGASQSVAVKAGQSPAQILAANGVDLGNLDRLSLDVSGDQPALVVKRVSRDVSSSDQVTKAETKEVDDDQLDKGQRSVVTKGVDGVARVVSFTEKIDGQVEFAKASAPVQITKMVPEVVHIGTKATSDDDASSSAAPASGADQGSAPAGVWAALAQCESGGNPASVSSNGLYHGLYQFTVSTWRAVGGSGLPSQASAAEQTKRAQILQSRSGWGQWPACARSLGLY